MSATGTLDHIVRPETAAKEEAYSLSKAKAKAKAKAAAADGTSSSRVPDPNQAAPPTSAKATYLPGADMPSGVTRVVTATQQLFQVRTMQQHDDLMRAALDRDVCWDAPPILMVGRHDMRLCVYLAKSIAFLSLEPELIHVYPLGFDRTMLEVQATCLLSPKRSLLVPPSLLLPRCLAIRATLKIGVKGPLDTGKIELIDGKWHNLPSLPNFVRAFNAFVMGTLPRLTEPLWSWTLELVGDDFYKTQRQRQQQQAAVAASSGGPAKKLS